MQNSNHTMFTTTVMKDAESDELVVELPLDMVSLLGWKIGDTLAWSDNGDRSFTVANARAGNSVSVRKQESSRESCGEPS